MKIYKYSVLEDSILEVPFKSELLKVGTQENKIVVWFMVSDEPVIDSYQFKIIMTGESFEIEDFEYIDTVFIGWLVCHVFAKQLDYKND